MGCISRRFWHIPAQPNLNFFLLHVVFRMQRTLQERHSYVTLVLTYNFTFFFFILAVGVKVIQLLVTKSLKCVGEHKDVGLLGDS